jgi:hypothetical protein
MCGATAAQERPGALTPPEAAERIALEDRSEAEPARKALALRVVAGRSGGAGHQGADVARERPCREGESAALRIGAGPGLALADESLVAGLGIQGGSPLAHQLCGHERMQHRRLLG